MSSQETINSLPLIRGRREHVSAGRLMFDESSHPAELGAFGTVAPLLDAVWANRLHPVSS